jgi:aminomethyltransferase
MDDDDLMLVVNASNVEKDLSWLSEAAPVGVKVEDASETTALIAVQGPDAVPLVAAALGQDLAAVDRFNHVHVDFQGERILVSRTGYTGEDGFEIYMPERLCPEVWEHLASTEGPWSPEPVGLGARDTLRFEASYRLYGNDIDETTNPLEAGLGWTVKLSKEEFMGREALIKKDRAQRLRDNRRWNSRWRCDKRGLCALSG